MNADLTPTAETIALIKEQFPDFDGEVLNVAPLKCEAWHNDACPVYREDVYGTYTVELWTDFVDPSKREHEGPRFIARALAEEGCRELASIEADSLEELREKLNKFHEDGVGYRPDDEEWTPLGALLSHVLGMPIEYDANED